MVHQEEECRSVDQDDRTKKSKSPTTRYRDIGSSFPAEQIYLVALFISKNRVCYFELGPFRASLSSKSYFT